VIVALTSQAWPGVLATVDLRRPSGGGARARPRPYEIVAPTDPGEQWLRERLVPRLISFCKSPGTPVPRCGGTIVALFVGQWLYGISAEEVIRWASGTFAPQRGVSVGHPQEFHT
jgi:hypothetical protein